MIKVFVTGSEGFVGQTFIKKAKKNFSIFGLTLKENHQASENVKYLECNILNRPLLKEFFEQFKPDVILHLAAISTSTADNLADVFDVNVNGTLSLYLAILDVQKKMKFSPRVIFVSSSEVYGKTNNPARVSETDLLNPISIYGSSKVAGDRLTYQLSQTHKFYTAVLRPFYHTGPGQRVGFFIPDVTSQIAEAEAKNLDADILVGNVDVTRDYLDVSDVVDVYSYFIENNYTPGDAYNICSGKGIKLSEILRILKTKSSIKINYKVDPARFRDSEVPVFVGNNKKLTEFSKWSPKIPIEKTLQDTLDYYRQVWKDKG